MKKTLTVKKQILSENERLAGRIRKNLTKNRTLGINIMASPGAGKTTVIIRTVEALKGAFRIAVIDGDIVELDIAAMKKTGIPVVLADTQGACHLDARRVHRALGNLTGTDTDLLIVENVGNLICPSHFDIGMHRNVVIASVPEGHDKPYKYPAVFSRADVVLLNKTDYMDREAFDVQYFSEGIRRFEHNVRIFPLCAKTGSGMDAWYGWLRTEIRRMQKQPDS